VNYYATNTKRMASLTYRVSPREEIGTLRGQLIAANKALAFARKRATEMEEGVNRMHDSLMRDPNPWTIQVIAQCLTILRERERKVIYAEALVETIERKIRVLNTTL
jgi:hypothetical protein